MQIAGAGTLFACFLRAHPLTSASQLQQKPEFVHVAAHNAWNVHADFPDVRLVPQQAIGLGWLREGALYIEIDR